MEKVKYHHSDLLDFDEELYTNLAHDKDVEILMITAGIGRIADFQFHHIAEIEKILTVDTVSTIKILRVFYERILAKENFYAGVMGAYQDGCLLPVHRFMLRLRLQLFDLLSRLTSNWKLMDPLTEYWMCLRHRLKEADSMAEKMI